MSENGEKKYKYTCNKEGCGRRLYKQGLCYKHYKETMDNGSKDSGVKDQKSRAKGHDARWKEQIKKVICIFEHVPMNATPEQKAELIVNAYERLYER